MAEDGSESAGLRERLQKQFSDLLPELVTSTDSTICVCPQECRADVVKELVEAALVALAPAISRPPTQGSPAQEEAQICQCKHEKRQHVAARGGYCIMGRCYCRKFVLAAQPPSLPPSRADLGGDRWTQRVQTLLFCNGCQHDSTWHGVNGCYFSGCVCANKSPGAVAEGQQSSELVEKPPSASPGEREARIAYVKNLAGVPIVERVTYPCGTTASEGSPPNDCPIHGSECNAGKRE